MPHIVTSTYRYKRPPRKRKAVALEVPAIVRRIALSAISQSLQDGGSDAASVEKQQIAANEDRKSAIVTVRRKGRAEVPNMTPEELQR